MTESIIAIVIGSLNLIGLVWVGLVRQARTDARVDILWSFLLRQGIASSLIGGLAERNSPLRVNVAALDQESGLVSKLREWYIAKYQRLSTLELFIELEKKFSREFSEVCEKRRILPGGCVAAALLLLRPGAYEQYGVGEKGERFNGFDDK